MIKSIFYPILLLLLIGCATSDIAISGNVEPKDRIKAMEIINLIKKQNAIPEPASFKAALSISGNIEGKPISASGNVYYKNNPLKAKIILKDLIFRSVIVQIAADDKNINIYSVYEKKIYTKNGNIKEPNFYQKNNSQTMLAYISTGKVPIIPDSKITGYTENPNKETGIILDSSQFNEIIYLKKGIPNKIIVTNKKTGNKFQIEYDNLIYVKSYPFYQKIKVKSFADNNSLSASYSNIETDTVINDSVFKLEVPSDIPIVKLP